MLDVSGPSYTHALRRDLKEWRTQVFDIDNKIAVYQKHRDNLMSKITGAEAILGEGPDADGDSVKALVRQLMEDKAQRRPKDIRRDLIARGVDPDRVPSSSGNLYNALVRLFNEGTLAKNDAGFYFWNPMNPDQ